MQEVKYFLRAIGDVSKDPTKALGIVSAADAESDLGYNYLSKGWKIQGTHYVGAIRDDKGNEFAYRLMHILVREDYEPAVVEASSEVKDPKKK